MKKLLLLIAFPAGIVGIAAIAGSMLPRDHVATMTVVVAAAPVKVWTAITDVAAYPSWRSDVKSVEILSRSPLSWKEVTGMGDMTLVTSGFQPPAHMVATISDEGKPFGGEWEYQVAMEPSSPDRARVTITERGWVSNPVFRFVSKFVMGHDSNIDKYLRALSRKFGPEADPVRVTAKDSS